MRIPRLVLLVALGSVILSAGFAFWLQDHPRVDAKAYDSIAWNWAQGLGYIEHAENTDDPSQDDAVVRVGPGYELFLGVFYKIFGHSIWIIWLMHALLRGATVIVLYLLAKKVFESHRVALLAGILFALSPDLIVISGLLLTETLFLFLLLLSTYISLIHLESGSKKTALASGFIWGITILTRPIALVPLCVLLLFLLWKKKIANAVIVFLLVALFVGSWSAFISSRHNTFVLTTTAGWYDLWVGNHLGARGGFEKSPEIQAYRNSHHSIEVAQEGRKQYFTYLTTEPLSFIELQFRKLSIYANAIRPGGFWIGLWDYPNVLLAILVGSVIWNLIFFIGGLTGMLQAFKTKVSDKLLFFGAVALVQPLGVIPIIVETRYRYPFFPFLAIFAAYFLVTRPWNKKIVFGVSALLAIFTLYDFWSNWGLLLERLNILL